MSEHASERKAWVNVGSPFITDAQSAITVQPSEGAFNDLTCPGFFDPR